MGKVRQLLLILFLLASIVLPQLPPVQEAVYTVPIGTADIDTFEVGANADDGRRQYSAGFGWQFTSSETKNMIGSRDALGTTFDYDFFARFSSVTIPAGSTINDAYIRFHAQTSLSGDTVRTNIYGCLDPDPDAPTSAGDGEWSDLTTAYTAWDFTTNWVDNTWYSTTAVNITAVIQELIDQGGWSSGNHMLLFVFDDGSSTDADRKFDSREEAAGYATDLYVSWTPGPNAATSAATSPDCDGATLNGSCTEDGGYTVDYQAFVWDKTSRGDPGNTSPASTDYATSPDGDSWTSALGDYGETSFNHAVTGCDQSTTYYFRAAIHTQETNEWHYGGELSFYTTCVAGSWYLTADGRMPLYRKYIEVSGATGAGTGYQIDVWLHEGSGSDGSGHYYLDNHCELFPLDTWFVDDDGTTLLDAWLDPADDPTGSTQHFIIKIDDSLETAGGFFVYYGMEDWLTVDKFFAMATERKYWTVEAVDATLTRSGSWGQWANEQSCVVKKGSTYYLFVEDKNSFGDQYDVSFATSSTPLGPFTKRQTVIKPTNVDGDYDENNVGAPWLILRGGIWYMFVQGSGNAGWGGNGLYTCDDADFNTSMNTSDWTRYEGPLDDPYDGALIRKGPGGWDSGLACVPRVIYDDDDSMWYMIYVGTQQFGTTILNVGIASASSPYGPWTKSPNNPIIVEGSSGTWDDSRISSASLINYGSGDERVYIISYTGDDEVMHGQSSLGIAYCDYGNGDDNLLEATDWHKPTTNPPFTSVHYNMAKGGQPGLYLEDGVLYSYHCRGNDPNNWDADSDIAVTWSRYYPSTGDDTFLAYEDMNNGAGQSLPNSVWTPGSNPWLLEGNVARDSTVVDHSIEGYNDATFTDHLTEARVRFNACAANDWVGVAAHKNQPQHAVTSSGYQCYVKKDGTFRILEDTTILHLDTSISTPSNGSWYLLGFGLEGANLYGYWQRSLIGSASDSTFSTGYSGIAADTHFGSGYARIDYWYVRKFVYNGGSPPSAGSASAEQMLPLFVLTVAADSITISQADLNGNITQVEGNATNYYFAWDTSSHSAPSGAPPGDYANSYTYGPGSYGVGAYDHTATGLSSCQTYYFRFGAYDGNITVWGSELSFVAGAVAPTVVTEYEADVEETECNLYGNITADGGAPVDEVGFDYGYSSGTYTYDWTDTGSFGNTTFNTTDGDITGLNVGDTVYWRGKAHNTCTWGYGSEMNFITKPGPPSQLEAESYGGDVLLSWANGQGIDDTTYDRTYIRGKIGGWPTGAGDPTTYDGYVAGNVTCGTTELLDTVPDTGNTTYYLAWSYAADAHGNYQWSDTYDADSVTVSNAPEVEATGEQSITDDSVVLTGYLHDDNLSSVDEYGFEWQKADATGYGNVTESGMLTPGPITIAGEDYLLENLTAGELYKYWAMAHNNEGWGKDSDWFMTRPIGPSFDNDCSDDGVCCDVSAGVGIILVWDKGTGAESTYIYRNEGGYPTLGNSTLGANQLGDGSVRIYSGSGTTTTDTSNPITGEPLVAGTEYFYRAYSRSSDATYGTGEYQWSLTSSTFSAVYTESPTVVTLGADITDDQATLSGSLQSLGDYTSSPVYGYFQYGTASVTQDGTVWTSASQVGWAEMTAPGLFQATATNLQLQATYYYRAAVRFGTEDSYGNVLTFIAISDVELGPPTNFRVSSFDETSITLAWDPDPLALQTHIRFGCASGCDFTGCPSTLSEGDIVTTTSESTITHSGLYTDVEYCYVAWSERNGVYSTSYAIVQGTPTVGVISEPDIIQIETVIIIEDYSTAGDQLIAFSYKLDWYDQTYSYDTSDFFYFQILDGTELLKQTRLQHWGYYPASIYIASTVALTWQYEYTARIIGVPDKWGVPPPSIDYSIVAETYAEDAEQLCIWTMELANRMQDSTFWEGAELIQVSGELQNVLTPYGAQIFESAIPGVSNLCPDLLGPDTSVPVFMPADRDLTYSEGQYGEARAAITHGDYLWGWLEGGAARAGFGVMMLVGLMWFAMYLLAVFALNKFTQHAGIAMVIGWLLLPVAVIFGGIEMGYVAGASILAAFVLTYQYWYKNA